VYANRCLQNGCANFCCCLLLIMHRQCLNSYLVRLKCDRTILLIMHILLCRQAILSVIVLASFYFVRSYYYLVVIYVSVFFTKVWLLTCCSYPWPRLLEPARCVTEPRVPVLAALRLPARLPRTWMRSWSLPLVSRPTAWS
jgi:hypothetical protein